MQLSRQLNRTRQETLQLLENEDELVHQLAFNAIEPIANPWFFWATMFESEVMGKKFDHMRHMPNYIKQQSPQQIQSVFAALRRENGK